MDGLLAQWPHFLLVLLRTSCLLVFWPVWDSRLIPVFFPSWSLPWP